MPLRFNSLLTDEGIDPAEVRLLRHQRTYAAGRTPYTLWRDRPGEFERYQSTQDPEWRAYFDAPYWASFVVEPVHASTLFVGLFSICLKGPVPEEFIDPLTGEVPGHTKGRSYDLYECGRDLRLEPYVGRLHVEWGSGMRSWRQRADRQDKPIIELARRFEEESFPGFTRFVRNLSEIEEMPIGWKEALRAARGIYLLACPRTREHYIGLADGEEGFLGRWREYVASGHGGNVAMRIRDPSDYQVSVLETVGSSELHRIRDLEILWKRKLLSREIGLNRN